MQSFNLHTLTVETAGQSGVGSLVSLTGITGAPEFREAVLNQREFQTGHKPSGSQPMPPHENELATGNTLLTEIRDSLIRIESILEKSTEQ